MDENLKNTNKDQVDVDHNDQGVADRPERKNLTPEQERYINRWSWGAFFGWMWWFVTSGITKIKGTKWLWIILYFIPYLTIIPWIKFSIQGRRLSWEQRNYKDFAEFKRRERFFTFLFLSLYAVLIGLYVFTFSSVSTQPREERVQTTQEFLEYSEQLDKEIEIFNFDNHIHTEDKDKGCSNWIVDHPDGSRRSELRCERVIEDIYGIDMPIGQKVAQIYDAFIENGWESRRDETREEMIGGVLDAHRRDGQLAGTGMSFKKEGTEVTGSVKFATKNIEKLSNYSFCDIFCEKVNEHSDQYDYFFNLFFRVQIGGL